MSKKHVPPTKINGNPFAKTKKVKEADKLFVFNNTGNVMLSTTVTNSEKIEEEVQDIFNEVTTFFAAMTKAISTSSKPNGKGKNKYYSIYDYDAIQKVVDGSGFFVHVNEEDIDYTSQSAGVHFSKELVEAILGLPEGAGALSFASAMVSSMGKAGLNFHESSSKSTKKVANIVFICEYLLGMPLISAEVISIDEKEVKQAVKIGPCATEQSEQVTMKMHKDIFLFVTPKFIKKYSGDLDSLINSQDYDKLIQYLKNILNDKSKDGGSSIAKIADSNDSKVTKLTSGKSYTINGENLENTTLIYWGSKDKSGITLNKNGEAAKEKVKFKVPSGTSQKNKPKAIYLYNGADELIAQSDTIFKIEKPQNKT